MAAPRPFTHAALLALSLAGAGTAAAQDADGQGRIAVRQMAVVGSAPQVCALQQGAPRTGRLVNVSGTDGNLLRIEQFVDRATLAVRAASAEVSFAAVCNFAHRVRLESLHNGLWPTDGRIAPPANGFATAVPYEARIAWGAKTDRLDADGKANRTVEQSFAVDTPVAGDLVLDIRIAEGASNAELRAPLVAGAYADTLRIVLEPR